MPNIKSITAVCQYNTLTQSSLLKYAAVSESNQHTNPQSKSGLYKPTSSSRQITNSAPS